MIDPNKYKHIAFNRDDQEHYGIHSLTGEACGLGMRTLFSLSEEAFGRFEEFIGTKMNPNKFVSNDYASLMLTWPTFQDFIVYSACVEFKYVVYVPERETDFGYLGTEAYATNDPETYQQFRKRFANTPSHYYERRGDAVGGTRNRHQFTGIAQ